jgi:hypothetical protein
LAGTSRAAVRSAAAAAQANFLIIVQIPLFKSAFAEPLKFEEVPLNNGL